MATGKLRVFIAEDSPHIVRVLADLIGRIRGIELIGHSPDADAAIRKIKENEPDIAILDIRMASGNGMDVLRALQAEQRKVPVIVVFTSHTEGRIRRTCLRLGAHYVFNKFSDSERLSDLLRSLARKSGLSDGEDPDR